MVNQNVARKIIDQFLPVDGPILEIGPGRGTLTNLLLQSANNPITAVEIDSQLIKNALPAPGENLSLIQANILDISLPALFPQKEVNILANVPYYMSKELIDWLICQQANIQKGLFMMQKEFVDKLLPQPAGSYQNAQAVVFNFLYQSQRLFKVNPGSFSPPPKVNSTVFEFSANSLEKQVDIQSFYSFVKTTFKNRRKTLLNNLNSLKASIHLKDILTQASLPLNIRAEQISLTNFLKIFQKISTSHS